MFENVVQLFQRNLQYRFDVPYLGEDEESDSKGDVNEIIVQLSQSDARTSIITDRKENVTIGFHIMQVESNRKCRVHQLRPESAVTTSDYIKTKHIFLRASMPKSGGRFVIIPTTFNPGETTAFLLRVFTSGSGHKANVKELLRDIPATPWYKKCCCANPIALVTRYVRSKEGKFKLKTVLSVQVISIRCTYRVFSNCVF